VLDGYTLNPGDLSWEGLSRLGACTVHDRTAEEDVLDRASGAGIVLTNKVILSREVIEQLPGLRYVGVLATGYDVVDVVAARERGIPVANVPAYGTRSVAQLAFAHLLNLAQRVAHHAHTVREGRWSAGRDFCYWDYALIELDGLVMGIVGFGRIGQTVARLALAFGMRVLFYDPVLPEPPPEGARFADLDTLFSQSDVVSLHCPLTPETGRLVDAGRISQMKRSALLVNTSRGGLVDEQALARALNEGRIAGAGLDVLSKEPPTPGNPLLTAKNCFVTPHVAWATRAARRRLLETAVQNVAAFLQGRPENVVNR
jgi:glycerate dehydrogenase